MNKTVDVVIPVYNDNPYLVETLFSIFSQKIPSGWALQVYVVDDGSEEPVGISDFLTSKNGLTLVRLNENQGVSVARNKGAFAGVGEVILFLDADCAMAHQDVIALMLEKYDNGIELCFGQIHVGGDSFWAKYQNCVAKKRAEEFIRGGSSSMTSQIFIVQRAAFSAVGGFDEAYHFGFEDRDLFISLIKRGVSVALVEEALVNHNDQLSLMSVTKKIFRGGKESSERFIEKHPEYYENMDYCKADVRYSRVKLTPLAVMTKPMLWPAIRVIDLAIRRKLLPFCVLKYMVRYASGLVYLHGTYNT